MPIKIVNLWFGDINGTHDTMFIKAFVRVQVGAFTYDLVTQIKTSRYFNYRAMIVLNVSQTLKILIVM
jgi:hypothetical protein